MKVKFLPQNVECEIRPGQSVLHVAQDNNIHIKSVCRGIPSCAECRVRIVEGEYNVIPPASQELGLIGTAWFVDHRRLSCQLRCFGDITVDLTEQVERESAGKKPRGRYNKDELQESRAVLGNLVMNDEDKKSGALKDDEEAPVSRPQPRGERDAIGKREAKDANEADDPRDSGHYDNREDFEPDNDGGREDHDDGDDGADESSGGLGATNAAQGAGPGDGQKRRRRRGRRGKGRRGGSGSGGAGGGGPGNGGSPRGGSRPGPA